MVHATKQFSGDGPGVITGDGCAVELYARSPYRDELALLAACLPGKCSVLELGCGAGRLTRPLLEQGHVVTAVDNSIDMLAHVPDRATKVRSDIETLALDDTFDVVLYASNLINVADDTMRRQQLAACRRHVRSQGSLIFQRFDPAWLREVQPGAYPATGEIGITIERAEHEGDLVAMSIRYTLGADAWKHHFTARVLEDEDIAAAMGEAGFGPVSWIDSRWGVANPAR